MARTRFDNYVSRTAQLHSQLNECEIVDFSTSAKDVPEIPAIYQFFELLDGQWKIVYVGRTRKLRQRLRSHVTKSPNRASFAFKRARIVAHRPTDYTAKNSATTLMQEEKFVRVFLGEIEKIKGMRMQFLQVSDPIEQYFLELYAAMDAGLDLKDFDTH